MKYYINGRRATKKEYKEQENTNKKLMEEKPGTVKEWDQWLKDMQQTGFLTRL